MKNDQLIYCPLCDEEHVLTATKDTQKNVVGWFCNRHKSVVLSDTTRWNGEDVYPSIVEFTRQHVDTKAIARLDCDRMNGLAKKMAYLFLQTDYAKDRSLNYYFAQFHFVLAIKGEVFV